MQNRNRIASIGLAWLLLAFPAAAAAVAGEVSVGDSADQVRSVLGEPRGHIKSGSYELLQYDRGRVELRDGVVTQLTLVSPEEAAAQKVEREQQARDARERQAAQREQRRLDGLAGLERTLQNPDFLAASGARQVEYWTNFRARYPDVPVDAEYTAALDKRDRERAEQETRQRLAAMEERVSAAEERAQDAERDAEDARRDARRRVVYSYPAYYYPVAPVRVVPVVTASNCRPSRPAVTYPTITYPYSHGYTSWGSPQYVVRPSTICPPSSTFVRSSGISFGVGF